MSKMNLKTTLLATLLPLSLMACQSNDARTSTAAAKLTPAQKTTEQTVIVNAVSAQGIGQSIGQIKLSDSPQGLRIETDLKALSPGFHGFHIHQTGNCAPAEKDGKAVAALSAGGHFNPTNVAHGTPNDGHLGDLPVLNVDHQGVAKTTVIAPRLSLAQLQGLAIMVHAGGDNYADQPQPLGGGGERIACGVIR